MSKRLVALLVPLLLTLASCGDEGSTTASDDPSASASTSEAAGSGAAVEGTLEGVTVTGEPGAEPTIEIAETPYEIDETTTQVIEEGSDVVVEEGDLVEAQYVFANGRTGDTVESSWAADASAASPAIQVVEGGLLPALYKGLIGQAEGSRVAVAAPAADAFGDQGLAEAGVEPGDSIVFVLDVVKVLEAMAEGTKQEAPAGLPVLETDEEGVPTVFTAVADTDSAPEKLVAAPVIVGDGPKVKAGQTLTVHYLGQLYPDGEIFDQSWTRGEVFTFQLGTGGVIQGWDQGLEGQTVGSRVVLAIPSELAYGKQGSPPTIPGNAPLLFSVDILAAS